MSDPLNVAPSARYLSIPRVCDKLSRRKTWLYDQMRNDPSFPRPLRINGRQVFLEHEIDRWVLAQTQEAAQ